MRTAVAPAGLVLMLLALLVVPAGPAAGQSPEGSRAVVLLHHPFDHVDPFGVPYPDPDAGTDTFSARHQGAAQNGRFDFPTFVADGVAPVVAIPDPSVPYASTLANYTSRIEARLAMGSPGTMALRGEVLADSLLVQAGFTPNAPLVDPQHPDSLHFFVAVAEDFIHYLPDARISNGVADHRFTVRALVDLGAVDLAAGAARTRNHTFPLPAGWARENLVVAAWIEAMAPFGRFGAGEALQAAWAKADGVAVQQASKSVLVEVYTATWCTPCLIGDKVAERIAIDYGGAPSLAVAPGPRYFEGPQQPIAAAAAALVAGTLMLLWRGRRAS